MEIPEEFVEKLEREFGQKYRIRWSDAKQEYHIEQKVRRGLAEGLVGFTPKNQKQWQNRYDDFIRVRDGYVLTMAIKPGTRTYCPECNFRITVPAFSTEMLACEYCKIKGRQRYQAVGYYPLGDSLIEHLKRIDSERGGTQRVTDSVDLDNQLLMRDLTGNFRRQTESGTRERFNRLVGIPQWGRTKVGTPARFGRD